LKSFNNWVKSVLITKYAHPALHESKVAGGYINGRKAYGRGKVLDMGCGKGGDLTKWGKAKIRDYIAVGASLSLVDVSTIELMA